MTRRFKIILFCYISAVLSIPVTAFILYTKPRLDFSKKVDAGLGVKALEDACLLYYDKYGELPLSEELTQGATLSTKETEGGLIDILYNPGQPKTVPMRFHSLISKTPEVVNRASLNQRKELTSSIHGGTHISCHSSVILGLIKFG